MAAGCWRRLLRAAPGESRLAPLLAAVGAPPRRPGCFRPSAKSYGCGVAVPVSAGLVLAATVGSTIQLVLLVAPLLVFAGRLLGQPMDLAFTGFEVVAIVLATIITRELIADGKANWFEGCLLLGVYLILAIGFYHLPE
jgi:Ca2+:H+ antiporter